MFFKMSSGHHLSVGGNYKKALQKHGVRLERVKSATCRCRSQPGEEMFTRSLWEKLAISRN